MRPFILLALVVASAVAAVPAHAASNRFATRNRGSWQDFGYQWRDASGRTQTLNFSLAAADIALGEHEFQRWDDTAANRQANQQVASVASRFSTPQLRYSIRPLSNGYSLVSSGTRRALNGTDTAAVEKTLHQTYVQSVQQFATRHFYTADEQGTNLVIQPDHPRLAIRYTPAMAPVAKAIRTQVAGQGAGLRAYTNATLNWLQSIPYDTLMNRALSNGAGFQTPYGMLVENRGDCDTKTTALAAILRSQYPTTPLAIVYIPRHAFLGIGMPQGPHDFALQTATGTYVLADPTGPALSLLGDIDPQTQAQLRAQGPANTTTVVPIP